MGYAIPRGVPAVKALREQRDRFKEILKLYEVSPDLANMPRAITAEKLKAELDALEKYLCSEEMMSAARELGLDS